MTSPSPARSAGRRSSGRITSNNTDVGGGEARRPNCRAIAPHMASGTESLPARPRRQLLKLLIVCHNPPQPHTSTSAAPVLNPTYSSDSAELKCHSLHTAVMTVKPDICIKLSVFPVPAHNMTTHLRRVLYSMNSRHNDFLQQLSQRNRYFDVPARLSFSVTYFMLVLTILCIIVCCDL